MKSVLISGNNLSLQEFIDVVRNNYRVELTEEAKKRLKDQGS